MTDAGVTKPRKEHKAFAALDHFTGAEISGFFFTLGFLQSLLKSPAGCGGHQTSQKPARAAQGPRADPEAPLPTRMGASRLPGEQTAPLQGAGSYVLPHRSRLDICTLTV